MLTILMLLVHEHTFSDTNSFWLSDLSSSIYHKNEPVKVNIGL